jgi:hypothetical protein
MKKRNKDIEGKKEERGSVLVLGVLIMTVLLIMAVPFLFQLSTENRLSEKSYRSLAAISLAEAGVERAIWELNHGDISTWSGDSDMRTMAISSFQAAGENVIGDIEIKVSDPEGENPIVEASGSVAHIGSEEVTGTIRVVLNGVPDMTKLFDFGVFGDDGVELSSQAFIDSYDSRLGEYGGANIGENGDTGTNATHVGAIYLNSNARVYGDVISGPGSDPLEVIVSRAQAQVTGESLALSSPKEMPSVPSPEGLPFQGSFILDSTNDVIISESGEYTSFMLDDNSKVTITEDVTLHITGDFSMLSNSQLEIAEGVSVNIYLGGTFAQNSNTQINNLSMDPTKLMVFGTDSFNGEMEWNSNTDFYGAVYVPKASVDHNSYANFYGSIAGRYLGMSSNSRIHFDEALADLELDMSNGEISAYAVRSWQQAYVQEQ